MDLAPDSIVASSANHHVINGSKNAAGMIQIFEILFDPAKDWKAVSGIIAAGPHSAVPKRSPEGQQAGGQGYCHEAN